MGLCTHSFNFLRFLSIQGPLGDVATIGRQRIDAPHALVKQVTGVEVTPPGFCEEVLMAMGATSVDSIDVSDYEGASHIADLNRLCSHPKDYDGVLDFGSLEHIFDIANGFRNVIALCRVGGTIVHVLPVNNLNGHGFWQFCSDLLYTLYSEQNGFDQTRIFYASPFDLMSWHEAPCPSPGKRISIVSVEPIILLCATRKARDVKTLDVQQPFYSVAWFHGSSRHIGETQHAAGLGVFRQMRQRLPAWYRRMRNTWLVCGLATGRSPYSVYGQGFRRISVPSLLGTRKAE